MTKIESIVYGVPGDNAKNKDESVTPPNGTLDGQFPHLFRRVTVELPDTWKKSESTFGNKSVYVNEVNQSRGYGLKEHQAEEYIRFFERMSGEMSKIRELMDMAKNVSFIESANYFEEAMASIYEGLNGQFDWGGTKKSYQEMHYDDYPSESTEYKFITNEILLPVLFQFEGSVETEQDFEAAMTMLSKYIDFSGDGENAIEFARSMAQIGGVDSIEPFLEKCKILYKESEQEFKDDLSAHISEVELSIENGTFEDVTEQWGFPQSIEGAESLIRYLKEQMTAKTPLTELEMEWNDSVPFVDAYVLAISKAATTPEEKRKTLEFISQLMKFQQAGTLSVYKRAVEIVGIEESIPMLLNNLKSEDLGISRMSAEILFRLELGRIGVTEKGVEYLGKLYDLGTYNDPDFFVRRLNNSGLMAVLAEDGGNIEGVFPLDLYAEGDLIHAEVRQLMSQELFLPRADETPQQRQQREHYLQLFLENYESIFNDDFFEGTGVRLNSLDLHEQGWFLLNYLELSELEDTEGLVRLKGFVSEYGEYGLKSFLALEYGGSGRDILDFAEGEGLSKEEKLAIFRNFYGIANEALNWREIFGRVEDGVGYEFAPQVHEAFIRKNAEFFKAAQIIAKGDGGDVTIGELLRNMDTVAFSLRALKGIYIEDSSLKLEQKPQNQDEFDKDGNILEAASSSFILVDEGIGARVVVFIRPQATVRRGNVSGGEARINFSVSNLLTSENARIGFDLSDYGEFIGEADKPPVVSLDMGVGKPDREAGIWPSQRVGRVLELVEGSEGGHNELSFRPEVAGHFPEVAARFKGYIENKFVK